MPIGEIETISSRDNTKLKHARAIRDGRVEGEIFIEGVRLVIEALRSDINLIAAFVSVDLAETSESAYLLQQLQIKRVPVSKVAAKAFGSIADTQNSQGIALLAERPVFDLAGMESPDLVVLLLQVNNPLNLGAVIRTAEAAGVSAVLTSIGSADAFSPRSIRASMGSCFRFPIIERITFDAVIAWARAKRLSITAADISGTTDYTSVDWKIPQLLIFGSEAHGLNERELAAVDTAITIPMDNGVESLNLAVSAGILLFEAKRQNET